jgi:hypothetical protein
MKRFLSILLVALFVVMGGVIVLTDALGAKSNEVVIRSEHYTITRSMLQCYYYDFCENVRLSSRFSNLKTGSPTTLSGVSVKMNDGYDHADEKHNVCMLDINDVPVNSAVSGSISLGDLQFVVSGLNGGNVSFGTFVPGGSATPGYSNSMQDGNISFVQTVGGKINLFPYIGGAIGESKAIVMRGGAVYTWWDYLMDHAIENARTVLAACEAAYRDGYTSLASFDRALSDQVRSKVDSVGSIRSTYGKNVKRSDLQAALELYTIAAKYLEKSEGSIESGITDHEIRLRYEENPADYQEIVVLEQEEIVSMWDSGYFQDLIADFGCAGSNEEAFYDASYRMALFEHQDRLYSADQREKAVDLAKRIVRSELSMTEKEVSNDIEAVAVSLAKKIGAMRTTTTLGKLDGHLRELLSGLRRGDVVVGEFGASGATYYVNGGSPIRVDTTEGNLPDSGEYGFVVIYVLEPVHETKTWMDDIRATLAEERFEHRIEEIRKKFSDSMTMDTEIIKKISG